MKTAKIILLAWLALIAAASAFAQQGPPTQIQTQQLTLLPQAPVAGVAQVVLSPSVQGNTTYYYWFVTHQGGVTSMPNGPFLVNQAPATLGGINTITITWTPAAPGVTYDVLRTATSTPPTGACGCGIATSVTLTSIVDSSPTPSAYTVATSASQVPVVCTNLGGCGSAGGGAFVTPQQSNIFFATQCNNATNCYQINDDGFSASGCSWTTSSATITCPAGTFASAKAGMLLGLYRTCQTNATSYRLDIASGATILSVTDQQHIVASSNPAFAETGASDTGCVFAGDPDDSGFAAGFIAWSNAPQCLNVILPAGIMVLTDPANFGRSSTGANNFPVACQSGIYTGIGDFPVYSLEGQGAQNSTIWIPPNFNTADFNTGRSGAAAFWNNYGLWKNFGFTSGGLSTFGFVLIHYFIESAGFADGFPNSFAYFDHFHLVNIAPSNGTLTCLATDLYYTQLNFFYEDGCGFDGLTSISNGQFFSFQGKFEDNGQAALTGANFISTGFNNFWDGPLYGAFGAVILGGPVNLSGNDHIFTNGAPSTTSCWSTTGINQTFSMSNGLCTEHQELALVEHTGATVVLDGVVYNGGGPLVGFQSSSDTGGRIFVRNTSTGSNTSVVVPTGAAPQFFDRGFNAFPASPSFGAGTVFTSVGITDAPLPTASAIALGAGFGTSTAGTFVGLNETGFNFTITVAGAQTQATSTITYTFPKPFPVAPSCSIPQQIGGTNPALTWTISTAPTATSVAFLPTGAATAGDTIILKISCQ